MKAVILAGGLGTRISEESTVRPKPMVEIGGKPILWHVMKIYACHGITEFIICAGYKGYAIKEYFANYFLHNADITFDLRANTMAVHHTTTEPWLVTIVDTGERTLTGGRLRRVRSYLGDETFCMTYGDGVSDVDITESIAFHRKQGALVTLTAVQPPGRFGVFALHEDQTRITAFREKPRNDGEGAWINGGFFVIEPPALDLIDGDDSTWERGPLERLSQMNQLAAYRHAGFWQPMDTLRDKHALEELWQSGAPPWKIW